MTKTVMKTLDINSFYFSGLFQLIFVDQEISVLPDAIVNLYHSRVRKMDLSFNQLTSLDGLEFFSRLDELVLDNNQLGDNIRIPKTKSITTLSLNNNKVILMKRFTFHLKLENRYFFYYLNYSKC